MQLPFRTQSPQPRPMPRPIDFKIHCSAIYNIMGNTNEDDGLEALEQIESQKCPKTTDTGLFELLIKYAKERHRFGKPLSFGLFDRLRKYAIKIDLKTALGKTALAIQLLMMGDSKGTALFDLQEMPNLSQGAKTEVENWFRREWYGKEKVFDGKYTLKGKQVEWEVVKYIGDLRGEFYDKNTECFYNDFMIGTPDVLPMGLDFLIDIKSSSDCYTLPLFEEPINKNYWWQMQGYMHLTGRKQAKIFYALMDTPESIIDMIARQTARNNGEMMTDEVVRFVTDNLTFSDLPDEMRHREYIIEYDPKAIAKVEARVNECRVWLSDQVERLKLRLSA